MNRKKQSEHGKEPDQVETEKPKKKVHLWNTTTGKAKAVLSRIQHYFPQVDFVSDGTEGLQLEVIAKDMTTKGQKNHAECALARACERSFHVDGAVVSRSRVFLVKGKMATRYNIPEYAKRELISFDRGAGFEPGTYELQRIVPSDRKDYAHGKRKRAQHKSARTPEQSHRHITKNVRASFAVTE